MIQGSIQSKTISYILGVALAFYTYFFYLVLPKIENYNAGLNITFMFFIIFIMISTYFLKGDFKKYINLEKKVLIIISCWFLVTFVGYYLKEIFYNNPEYYSFSARNFFYLTLIILFVALVSSYAIDKMLVSIYIIYFIYGIYLISTLYEAKVLGVYPPINKNVVGFFILPFVAYVFMKLRNNLKWTIVWYLIGSSILFITGARTSFVSFLMLPVFLFVIKFFKSNLRFFYSIYIFLGFLGVLFVTYGIYPVYDKINFLFTDRILLWETYLNYLISSKTILLGTSYYALPELMQSIGQPGTIHPHNQFIMMLVMNGLIGLIFFVSFLLLSFPKKVDKLIPADGVLFVLITIQFSEAIIPLFDFSFLSFVFVVNILINKNLHNGFSEEKAY